MRLRLQRPRPRSEGGANGKGLLARAGRGDGPGCLQALRGGEPDSVPQIRRPLCDTRRPPRGHGGHLSLAPVVIEFPDYDAALACYRSPEYQHAMTLRQGHAVADIAVVEGYDGPQP